MPQLPREPPNAFRKVLAQLDESVELAVDRVRGHKALDRTMYLASELGDMGLIWHIFGAAQGLRRGDEGLASAARVSVLLGVESVLVNGGIKSLFRRKRPEWERDLPRPHRLRQPRTSSFPSGHASAAFTAARVLSQDDPLWPLYYAVAGLVASSRVYVKIHHASDVIGGVVVGAALGTLARRVWPAPGMDDR